MSLSKKKVREFITTKPYKKCYKDSFQWKEGKN